MQKCEGLSVGLIFPNCSMEGKTPTLSDPCRTSPVNKHHTHNEQQPTLRCLSFITQTDFPVKAKTQIKLSADKGGGIMTGSILFTLLTCLRCHTDFAQVSSPLRRGKSPPFPPSLPVTFRSGRTITHPISQPQVSQCNS